ncbi:diguanylate cyclase [Actinoplanes subtropicus]|uniref:diguanylate cyclase n=1 Tax=Actinoplanes subtropicus TaxID=543632 RepID=UPI0004C3CA8F|nr:diguanylate cyclase [Actinoplanes subtropicus]
MSGHLVPDGAARVLYHSERTLVTRVALPGGGTVIRKQMLGPDAEQRLRHERAMLRRLDGLERVPRPAGGADSAVAGGRPDGDALLLADEGGVALASVLAAGPMAPAELLALAVDLAELVAAVHGRHVVHKDVNPGNILLAGTPPRPVLIDFDVATTFAEDRPGFLHADLIAGTLAYLAPEQTVPGVGKSSLVDELRPVVAAAGGWFVSGKFDQFREDLESDGVRQALIRLCQLLLAEPESGMPALRQRLHEALGSNTEVMAALLPEFALLMDSDAGSPAAGGPVNRDQLVQMGLDFLYAVATPARPVVLVLDDLQWAAAAPIALVDAVLNEPERTGLLLVGAYREAEVDVAHPLTAMLARWPESGSVLRRVRLHNLPPADLGMLLAELLRLAPERAAALAEAVAARTGGNPYDSLELLNALRREGTLSPGPDGWRWDPAAVRRCLGSTDVVELLNARIEALPADTRGVLEIMACLGGEVTPDLLAAASGAPADVLAERLLPALEDGLLVTEGAGAGAVRFRHDRVQQAAFARLAPPANAGLQLTLARRLVMAGRRAAAAVQYLPAVDLIGEPGERHRVAGLFHETACGLRILQPAMAERLLRAAVALLGTEPGGLDARLPVAVDTELHAALFALGRLEDADEVYRSIERRCPDPLDRVAAACVQIAALTGRNRQAEAVALGLDLLARLGFPAPAPDEMAAEITRGMAALTSWAGTGKEADLSRPEIADPRVRAACVLMNRLMPAARYAGPALPAWLLVQAHRLWAGHGPCEPLVAILGNAGFLTIAREHDYRTGQAVGRHLIAVSEAHGYESGVAHARLTYTLNAAPWFEPLEVMVREAHRAREDLLRVGDLQIACYAYPLITGGALDCAPNLGALLTEVESGLAFCHRTGNRQVAEFLTPLRQLVRALRGETEAPDSLTDATFDETAHVAGLAPGTPGPAALYVSRAVAAVVAGNIPKLAENVTAATALLPMFPGAYASATIRLLQGLSSALRIPGAPPDERAGLLAGLDACRTWFTARAADAPANFTQVARFLEAEHAAAVGDPWGAATAFDEALRAARAHRRPLQRALIAERAALFHHAHGLEISGGALLAEARSAYAAWGAVAKTRRLDERHPWLAALSPDRLEPPGAAPGETRRSAAISGAAIDLLGVLKASQALSSETNLDRLRARVSDVLGAMTGATAVRLLLRDETHRWDPADAAAVPISVIRYTERTREPLLVEDAAHDDRFRRDPYLTDLACCALMVVPIFAHGAPRGMLLLENRLARGAFTTDRLDAVRLVAGQLAVSLDNALLYASLEGKVAERTEELARANERLEQLAVTDALTGLPNRRRLGEILEAEWRRGMRPKTPLAVAMIDIDQFKLYNDHYGHPAGDRCLRLVATTLAGNLRNTDYVTRYGGEEFCLVMPETDVPGAVIAAERARTAVEALAEPHATSANGIVTISIGVAAVTPTPHAPVEDLLRQADEHLYAAKRGGRNRTAGEAPD